MRSADDKAIRIGKKTDRETYIDYIRVFSMCLVIALHCVCDYHEDMYNSEKLSWWIIGFINEVARIGVPLFFMISGYLILRSEKTKNIKEFYKKRLSKILIPFLIYSVLYYIYFCVTDGKNILSFAFIRQLADRGTAYHLWFIYSILLFYLFAPFIKRVIDNAGRKMLLLFLILVLFQTTLKPFINIILNGRIYLYLAEDGVTGYFGYMVLGYILGSYEIRINRAVLISALAVTVAGFALVNSIYAYKTWSFLLNGGYELNHYLEASMAFLIFKGLDLKHGKLMGILSALCMNVYFVHVFFIDFIGTHISRLPLEIYFPALFVISTVLSFSVSYIIAAVSKRLQMGRIQR